MLMRGAVCTVCLQSGSEVAYALRAYVDVPFATDLVAERCDGSSASVQCTC